MADEEKQEEGKKKKGGLLKIIILVVVVLGAMAGGMFLGPMVLGGKEDAAETTEHAEGDHLNDEIAADAQGHGGEEESGGHGESSGGHGEEPELDSHGNPIPSTGGDEPKEIKRSDLIYQFDPFTTNLNDPKGREYLVVKIQLEAASMDMRTVIEDNMFPLRDATLMLLASKKREDLEPISGRMRLKRELMAKYERIIPGAVSNIFIGDLRFHRQ